LISMKSKLQAREHRLNCEFSARQQTNNPLLGLSSTGHLPAVAIWATLHYDAT
jgi:hypothetical protein